MDKYEISLWEDYPDLTSNNVPFLNERKICVIGSNDMTSAARALEPKLISNVNGTHTFTFRIYYRYSEATNRILEALASSFPTGATI